MVQKCMYCGREIPENSVLTVCEICGQKVWGMKMFNAIKQNMEEARDKGDLCHNGSFTEIENNLKTRW